MAYCFQCHPSTDKCDKCHPDGPPAEKTTIPPPAKRPQVPSADASRATFEQLCSKCHALYPVSLHSKSEWAGVVDRMRVTPAPISAPEDKALILSYIDTAAKP